MGSSLKTRMIMIPLPEWEKGSQGSAWGMLQRERVLQGAGKAPAYSVPCRERVNENPAGNPQGAWQIYRKVRTKAEAWRHENMPPWKKQLIYEYENKNIK